MNAMLREILLDALEVLDREQMHESEQVCSEQAWETSTPRLAPTANLTGGRR